MSKNSPRHLASREGHAAVIQLAERGRQQATENRMSVAPQRVLADPRRDVDPFEDISDDSFDQYSSGGRNNQPFRNSSMDPALVARAKRDEIEAIGPSAVPPPQNNPLASPVRVVGGSGALGAPSGGKWSPSGGGGLMLCVPRGVQAKVPTPAYMLNDMLLDDDPLL